MSVKFPRTFLCAESLELVDMLIMDLMKHISVEGMDICVDVIVELIKLYTEGC